MLQDLVWEKMTKTRILKNPKYEHRVPGHSRERQKHVGVLTMSGPYVAQNKGVILGLICDTINGLAQGDHPTSSIRIAENRDRSIKVTFADANLARDIGRNLHQKYKGELDVQVDNGGKSVRVTWWS